MVLMTFIISCEGKFYYNYLIRCWITIVHHFFTSCITMNQSIQNTQLRAHVMWHLLSHIGTSIEVESYMFKPNCWFSKPSMMQIIIGIFHGVQKIAQNILGHTWTIHQNTFDTIGLHTPWWQQQNHIYKFFNVAWTFICLEQFPTRE
jgi:hypothetical protein